MSTTEGPRSEPSNASVGSVDMKLEAVVIPVSDVDRAKEFYERLGWRLDADLGDADLPDRPVQPAGLRIAPSSSASVSRRPRPARRRASSWSPTSRPRTTTSPPRAPIRARSSTTAAAATTAGTRHSERAVLIPTGAPTRRSCEFTRP